MSSRIPHLVRHTALLLLAAALFAPTATASRYGPGSSTAPTRPRGNALPQATCHQYCDAVTPRRGAPGPTTPVIVRTDLATSPDQGFDWLDAAIGFGAAWGAMLLGGGVVFAKRRAHLAPAEPVG